MTVYYYQNGFLHTDGTPPEGAVALTAAEHEALVVGQCAGQIVMPGKDGKPVLADPAPCPSSTWDGKKWTLTPEAAARQFSERKTALLGQAATAAQAFVNTAADVDNVPEFELQTWPLQSAEALAWGDNNTAATPMLDTIAAARGIERESLIKKALKKAREYRLLTAHVAGRRQAIEAAINAATTLDALDAIQIAYTAPTAPVAIDAAAAQPHDERAQNSAAIEAESGSTAIESGSGSAVIGD